MQRTVASLLIFLFIPLTFAQNAPQGINWQGVLRGNDGNPLQNQTVSLQFKINESTANGATVYTQTETITTNSNGLVDAVIGDVTNNNVFSAINWRSESYFLEVAVDIAGGTNYSILGTTQLLSVPYALHANTSESSIKLEDASGNTQMIANSNQVAIKFGPFEPYKFANNKMTFRGAFPNLGNNLQLEFTDGANSNKIESISPNLASLPTPGNVDYTLNFNVKGNETLSARGDGTVRINDSYVLPNAAGSDGQILVSDASGNLNWETFSEFTDTDDDTKMQLNNVVSGDDNILFKVENRNILRLGLNTTGEVPLLDIPSDDVIIGNEAGFNITNDGASNNVFIGKRAGRYNTSGVDNVYTGNNAGRDNDTGNENVMIGRSAGLSNENNNNVFLGAYAGASNGGAENVFIGNRAGSQATGSTSGNIFIGYNSGRYASVNNRLFIENSDSAAPLIYGEFDTNLVRVNGTLETTSNTTIGGNATVTGNTSTTGNTTTIGSTNTNTLKVGNSSTLSGIYKVAIFKNVGNVGGNSGRTETFTVTGASPGDVVFVSPSESLSGQIVIAQCWVSSNNTVSVRFRNTDSGSKDPDEGDGATYYISVIK